MIKEALIAGYLALVKGAASFFNLFPLQNKTVFLSSFGNNAYYVAAELATSSKQPLIFLNKTKCTIDFSTIPANNKKILKFETANIVHLVCSLYHLATAKYIFIDNYVGILSVMNFRKSVRCVQLWHATGAIKRFGWCEPATKKRSCLAQKRFQQVYDRFHFIPVSSRQMAQIFAESFHLDDSRFLYTGVPQTDFYFDDVAKARGLSCVRKAYPSIVGKRVVLYAPTYRKELLPTVNTSEWIEKILAGLDDHHILLLRLHPSAKESINLESDPRLLVVSDYPSVNELLIATDVLVSDYSSISFDFSLLRKKMIFFTYDYKDYKHQQGLWATNDLYFPGPIVTTTSGLIRHLNDTSIDFDKIDRFREHWNTYSTGQACKNLISSIYDQQDL
ncbi:CDP-glycerol glycerophosphotransferase family protein [Planococcus salinus]|uniref:Teichoic acid biosynthesis protein B n=1 Tax=Planococcus salinus TaxID=1848460 RepID=A0A3M8P730_9BACL|nr:CDP-glycerol glycerophosphotransferase family protein [Planococcus salinus]RNF39489.1 teichoic acid biosynthesis protein B [Planococcus salinus]